MSIEQAVCLIQPLMRGGFVTEKKRYVNVLLKITEMATSSNDTHALWHLCSSESMIQNVSILVLLQYLTFST